MHQKRQMIIAAAIGLLILWAAAMVLMIDGAQALVLL